MIHLGGATLEIAYQRFIVDLLVQRPSCPIATDLTDLLFSGISGMDE